METTITAKWQNYVTYGDERPNPQTMIENDRVRVIIAGLKPGKRIPRFIRKQPQCITFWKAKDR
jgi:hypothetical protein